MVFIEDIIKASRELGIENGDILLVHSSLSSLGYVYGGAYSVIEGLKEAVGEAGTLVMPTLCQSNWENVYKDWNINRPSDVGQITEVFRKLDGVKRSNQATHSVAAYGRLADEITKEHCAFGLRYGIFGDTPFSESSPWQKMYDRKAKVMFIGVSMRYNTFKHFLEYRIIQDALNCVKDDKKREELKSQVWHYSHWNDRGIWVFHDSEKLQGVLDGMGMVKKASCGKAQIISISIHEALDTAEELFKQNPEEWYPGEVVKWLEDCGYSVIK